MLSAEFERRKRVMGKKGEQALSIRAYYKQSWWCDGGVVLRALCDVVFDGSV